MASSIVELLRKHGEDKMADALASHEDCHNDIAAQAKQIAELEAQVAALDRLHGMAIERQTELEAQVERLASMVAERDRKIVSYEIEKRGMFSHTLATTAQIIEQAK